MASISSAIRSEGGLLPADLLARVQARDPQLPGLRPDDDDLPPGITINEAINRSWSWLLRLWRKAAPLRQQAADGAALTAETRAAWLEPLCQELGFRDLQRTTAVVIEGREYAISHRAGPVALHLIGFGLDLDRKTAGAAHDARASPHGLLQEFLNRASGCTWGLVSNGRCWRLLRQRSSLTRQAFVEFDLAEIFDTASYPDYAALWLVCHRTRFGGPGGAASTTSFIEQWTELAAQSGTRAREHLRAGVEQAIRRLGTGFLAHPANTELRRRLQKNELTVSAYYQQLLRLVYRLVFLFVSEDRVVEGRSLLLDPRAPRAAAELYDQHYATRLLRQRAMQLRGTAHGDGWEHLLLLFRLLGHERGCPELALPYLGGLLFSEEACPDLDRAQLANRFLYPALRALCEVPDAATGTRRRVDFRQLGAEELGSVYEGLLELIPRLEGERLELQSAAGNERKTTGSYYTPSSLIEQLLDSALDPILDEAASRPTPEAQAEALLQITVCDPACGSGHFLIAAAHRIAKRLASVRSGEPEPPPRALHHALREVIACCIYGVDLNPLAVELCKVSLWLEGMEPGTPLAFLDAHIKCGNSLIGATPEALAEGIPDKAYEPLVGDERQAAQRQKAVNRRQRQEPTVTASLFALLESDSAACLPQLRRGDDGTLAGIRAARQAWERWQRSPTVDRQRWAADAWVAAFCSRKTEQDPQITTATLRTLQQDGPQGLLPETRQRIAELAARYRPFHWHLEFPQVFAADGGGFSVVLGNPPWERVKLQEKEFFAARDPEIANARHAHERKQRIAQLQNTDPQLWEAYREALREQEALSALLHSPALYPYCGVGDVNTYAVFAERMASLLAPHGLAGIIVPTSIAIDYGPRRFFRMLVDEQRLVSLYDFENRQRLFPDVDSRYRFCLLTIAGRRRRSPAARFVFYAQQTTDLLDPQRQIALTAADIAQLKPNTRTCPILRHRRDADIALAISRRIPVLIQDADGTWPERNPWGARLAQMFNMSNDSGLFRTRDQLLHEGWQLQGNCFRRDGASMLPLYEGKMLHLFDHRWATFEGDEERAVTDREKNDPRCLALPRYWVHEAAVVERSDARLAGGVARVGPRWLLAFRDIARATDERTLIVSVLPRAAVGHSAPIVWIDGKFTHLAVGLLANLAALICDSLARLAVGIHLNFHIVKQLPVLPPEAYTQPCPWSPGCTVADFIRPYALELAYTAEDVAAFAADHGYHGPPFRWNPERRARLRAELDAAFFHLYGLDREDTAYLLSTFPVLERHEHERWGEYRTARLVLEAYDRMAAARHGGAFVSCLDPPPADPRCAHDARC
ncbi:MAG: N-6 DNA methylase [Planctomycetota bacterium]|nr:N-6 DNA methylase [Planctomycetota bacterium]